MAQVTVTVPPRPILLSNGSNASMSPGEKLAFRVYIGTAQASISAADYAGNSVAAQINAAITDANGRRVIIPPSMGAGEGVYPVGTFVEDQRAGTPLSGSKSVINASDANGFIKYLIIDDQTNPTLSNAAALFGHRPTGTLPAGKTGEGSQSLFLSIGTINNSPANYVGSGSESNAEIGSLGGKIPNLYGSTHTAATNAASTTAVGTLTSGFFAAPVKNGAGVIDNAYGIIVGSPGSIAAGENYGIWNQGAMRADGDIALNRHGASGGSTFYSGAAVNYYYLDVGRTAGDLRLGVAGAANDFFTGTVQGDVITGALGNKAYWLMANMSGVVKVEGTKVSLAKPLYPAQDTGAIQTASAMWAGTGVPSNSNGSNGDFYFRGDTPGSANQRLYVKTAGSWVGIL